MSEQVAHSFVQALKALEQAKDAGPLVNLYTEDATIGNILTPGRFRGPEGARQFWTEYRGTFETLESSFRNIIAMDDKAALEWTTTGTGFDGAPFEYSGVTILEAVGDKVTRSTAYFDPKALGKQLEVKS